MYQGDVLIQEANEGADEFKLENDVDPFGAEQTQPIEEDMKCDPEYEQKHQNEELGELEAKMEKLQIKVLG